MGHYKSNIRDIEFTLFEVLGLAETLQHELFAEVDETTARGILADAAHLAEYARLAATADGFAAYLDRHVHDRRAA